MQFKLLPCPGVHALDGLLALFVGFQLFLVNAPIAVSVFVLLVWDRLVDILFALLVLVVFFVQFVKVVLLVLFPGACCERWARDSVSMS